MHLKVDVESGKLIIKKSKDGSEDKFYSHKKSKPPASQPTLTLQRIPHVLLLCGNSYRGPVTKRLANKSLSYFSIAVTKHHGHDDYKIKRLMWGSQLLGKVNMAGSMVAGRPAWRWISS